MDKIPLPLPSILPYPTVSFSVTSSTSPLRIPSVKTTSPRSSGPKATSVKSSQLSWSAVWSNPSCRRIPSSPSTITSRRRHSPPTYTTWRRISPPTRNISIGNGNTGLFFSMDRTTTSWRGLGASVRYFWLFLKGKMEFKICRLMWEQPKKHYSIDDFDKYWTQSCEADGQLAGRFVGNGWTEMPILFYCFGSTLG